MHFCGLKNKKSMLTLVILTRYWKSNHRNQTRKEIKCMEIRKKVVELSLFGNDIILHLKWHKSTQNLLELINEFS